MQNKINNKSLLIAFLILLVLVVFLFTRKDGYNERSFNKQLLEFDTAEITQIKLFPRSLKGASFDINKEEENWMIASDGQSYRPSINAAEEILSTLKNMEAKSVVANSKDRWENYEVNDSLASRVQLFKSKKKVADVYIGKFQFSQPRSMSTYIRLANKKETYKVDGFLSNTFNRDVDALRDKTVIDDPTANWTEIAFSYPADSSFVLSKTNGKWLLDGALADSASVANYINTIKKQSASSIAKNDEDGTDLFKIEIKRENPKPIELFVREIKGQKQIRSSENEDIYFNDENLIQRIAVSREKFKIKP